MSIIELSISKALVFTHHNWFADSLTEVDQWSSHNPPEMGLIGIAQEQEKSAFGRAIDDLLQTASHMSPNKQTALMDEHNDLLGPN